MTKAKKHSKGPRKPKVGEAYELFAYEKFRRLFPDATVAQDEHVVGILSGEDRQIDVSVRFRDGTLIAVSCKDRTRKATLPSIDDFAGFMRDVGAAKGFLMSAPGFAKTTHRYARAIRIELITIEDMKHPKWTARVKIPVRLNDWRHAQVRMEMDLVVSEELAAVAKGRDDHFTLTLETPASTDRGRTRTTLGTLFENERRRSGLTFRTPGQVTLTDLYISIFDVWTKVQLDCTWIPTPKVFFKEVTPEEYTHLINHGRGILLPLRVRMTVDPDDGWVEVDPATPDAFPGVHVIIDKDASP
ncbi:restriction endonuclease [Myxococcota bacterium]|nr:restriction endonuclease [Myxococcota bacterium]